MENENMNEEFVLYKFNDSGNKSYLETIYANSISTDSRLVEAMRFTDRELALKLKDFINKRENYNFKVMMVKTELQDIEQ